MHTYEREGKSRLAKLRQPLRMSSLAIVSTLLAAGAMLGLPQAARAAANTDGIDRYELDVYGSVDVKRGYLSHQNGPDCQEGYLVVVAVLLPSDPNRQEAHRDIAFTNCDGNQAKMHFDVYMRSDRSIHVTGQSWLEIKTAGQGGATGSTQKQYVTNYDWYMWPDGTTPINGNRGGLVTFTGTTLDYFHQNW